MVNPVHRGRLERRVRRRWPGGCRETADELAWQAGEYVVSSRQLTPKERCAIIGCVPYGNAECVPSEGNIGQGKGAWDCLQEAFGKGARGDQEDSRQQHW